MDFYELVRNSKGPYIVDNFKLVASCSGTTIDIRDIDTNKSVEKFTKPASETDVASIVHRIKSYKLCKLHDTWWSKMDFQGCPTCKIDEYFESDADHNITECQICCGSCSPVFTGKKKTVKLECDHTMCNGCYHTLLKDAPYDYDSHTKSVRCPFCRSFSVAIL